jgi:outer membrane protein assembly factor BamB
MSKITSFIVIALLSVPFCFSQNDFSQWRGPNRNGIYPEKNLLTEWPEGGPELLWKYDQLGSGFSSVAATTNRVFATGTIDSITYVFSFDPKGTLLWKKPLGPDWMGEWPGIYSSPVISKGYGFVVNSLGVLYCFSTENGSICWSKDLFREFDGRQITGGFLDNLILDGDTLFCAPGGAVNNIVALSQRTGKLIWKSKGDTTVTGYGSPILIRDRDKKLYVYQDANSIRALNTTNGQLDWKYSRKAPTPNTPLYRGGQLFALDEQGSFMLRLAGKDAGVQLSWKNPDFFSFQGDAVLINDQIFGKGKGKKFCCIDWLTGQEIYSTPIKAMVVMVIAADGLLYCYDFNGTVTLLKPLGDRFETRGSFAIPGGIVEHCSHPVIQDGKLYIRHDNSLFVYNISKEI